MTLDQLKNNLRSILYFEDTSVIDVLMASHIAFRLGLGDKLWLLLIGESSAGKSQLLRPLKVASPDFVFTVDDITENTLLSGKQGGDVSLLKEIGDMGTIVMSDLTVLFSKNSESRNAVLSQLRMVYDGEMTKRIGTGTGEIAWKGNVQIIGGCTNSAYRFFAEVADMGERFLYYAMPPVDAEPMTRMAVMGTLTTTQIDERIGGWYREYMETVVRERRGNPVVLEPHHVDLIVKNALFVARMRTPIVVDDFSKKITHIPKSENPARVAKQLKSMVFGLLAMGLSDERIKEIVERCAWSMGSYERRVILKALVGSGYGDTFKTEVVGNIMGLSTEVAERYLQDLAAIGIVQRDGAINAHGVSEFSWSISKQDDYELVDRVR